MRVRKRMPAGKSVSAEKSDVAKIEKMIAGTASSVTILSKTGWSLSVKMPFHFRSRTIPTIMRAMMTNW